MVRVLSTRRFFHAAVLALLALAVVVSRAAANIPAPVTKTNTVRDQAQGTANGRLTTKVTYTHRFATASASTGNTIGLAKGSYFRLHTCVAYHLNAKVPLSTCTERTVDTRSNTATVYTHAPRVRLRRQPRPTSQPWGYFTSYSGVMYRNGGSWLLSAHSWPDNGLQGAGIAVAAQDQDSGTLPPNSIVTLDGAFTGALNSGQPDSICHLNPAVSDGSALPAGVSTSHPAFSSTPEYEVRPATAADGGQALSGAPGYYEVGLPTGADAGQAPRGIMLVIHSGGWTITGVGGVQVMRRDADRWRARGWQTVNLTNRACGYSLADVLWFYDKTRAWFGDDAKVCSLGTSAGGHLALLIGAYRPNLYCAVSQAGPTDLRTIHSEVAYDAATGLHSQTLGGRWVHNLAAAAFGGENLHEYSPAAQASPMLKSTRVLQAFSADDALVPYEQAADLANAMLAADPAAYVDNIQLATGSIPFAHGRVSRAALDDFHDREAQLVALVSGPTVQPRNR